jgi:oxygen-independent coproporphyrinogen-3 oxidase
METADRMAEAGLLVSDGKIVRLTPRGRLLSNDVFQEFLDLKAETAAASSPGPRTL